MALRIVPRDPRVVPFDGWCLTTPHNPPLKCSWCGVPYININGAKICSICDIPRKSGELRPVNIDDMEDNS